VDGIMEQKSGTIKSYLKKNAQNMMYSSKKEGDGQFSVTHYKVIAENGNYSLLDVHIDSGRKNQIRVHLGDIGHNVIGDDKYGNPTNPIKRLGLHAYELELTHPVTKKNMKFTGQENQAEVIFVQLNGKVIGFALYFLSFSTYLGNVNMHLEDLFIEPEHRGNGYGKALLKELGKIVIDRGYGRFEWTCLSWNKSSIDFYLNIGAEMKDWELFHFKGDALKKFVEE
jgi:GNAT superfamily N-acetyltransferase